MCGNVALISTDRTTKRWQDRKAWMKDAIILDTVRGVDSTGIALVEHSDMESADVIKWAVPGPVFLENRRVDSALTSIEKYAVVMGHNRAATVGKVNSANSHPFQHGHITLCHNGTLTSRNGVSSALAVDSEAICHAFAEKGAIETIEQLKGAYALQWYDAKEKTYNLARNTERPLCFAFLEDGSLGFVASESWMIRALVNKHKFKLLEDAVWSLNPGYIATFSFGNDDLTSYKSTPFEINKTTVYGGGQVNFGKGSSMSGTPSKQTDTVYGKGGKSGTSEGKAINEMSSQERISCLGDKRRAKYAERLKHIGLTLGQTVMVADCCYTPYNKLLAVSGGKEGTQGKVEGLIPLGDNKYVLGTNFTVDYHPMFEDLKKLYQAEVIGAANRDSHLTLVLHNLRPFVENKPQQFWFLGPDNQECNLQQMQELCKDGCCVCNNPIDIDEDGFMLDWANGLPICPDCWMDDGEEM